jgi:putative two-component system response regulator
MYPNALDQLQLLRIVQDLHGLRRQREKAYDELARAHRITLSKLALAAEYRDGDTGTHIVRLGALSGLLARSLAKPESWCEDIEQAAPMHDIGKIGIPDEILKKPGGLTAAEREIMETHAIIGAQILGNTDVPVLCMAAEIALNHHEQWDGNGYPRRLKGEEIPEAARIVAVIDFIDALTMDRCYRKAFSDEEVLSLLWSSRGTRFEPRIVDAAIKGFQRLTALRDAINRVDFGHELDAALGGLGRPGRLAPPN